MTLEQTIMSGNTGNASSNNYIVAPRNLDSRYSPRKTKCWREFLRKTTAYFARESLPGTRS